MLTVEALSQNLRVESWPSGVKRSPSGWTLAQAQLEGQWS